MEHPLYRQRSTQHGPAVQYANARLFQKVSDTVLRLLVQSPVVGMDVGPYVKVGVSI